MYDKMMWFNEKIPYKFHSNIVEYDMVAASVSISERFGLLPKEEIEIMKLLPKEKRTIRMGCHQRDNKEFSDQLINCELEIRRKFIETNHLNEYNILSLHNDAIIFDSKQNVCSEIDGIKFRHANTWSGYINYDNVELFYNDGTVIYKGIPKEFLKKHTMGMHQYFSRIFEMIDNYDEDVINFVKNFQMKYLQDKLPSQYYLSFNKNGEYKIANLKMLGHIARIVNKEYESW